MMKRREENKREREFYNDIRFFERSQDTEQLNAAASDTGRLRRCKKV